MRIQEIIRSVLDLIDKFDQESVEIAPINPPESQLIPISTGDDINRFKQIIDLADSPAPIEYNNEPCPAYASLDAVTVDAGGGMNGPKHPADIRLKDPSAYPEYKEQDFENDVNDKHSVHIMLLKKLGGIQ